MCEMLKPFTRPISINPMTWFRPSIHNSLIDTTGDATGDALARKSWKQNMVYIQIRAISGLFCIIPN